MVRRNFAYLTCRPSNTGAFSDAALFSDRDCLDHSGVHARSYDGPERAAQYRNRHACDDAGTARGKPSARTGGNACAVSGRDTC